MNNRVKQDIAWLVIQLLLVCLAGWVMYSIGYKAGSDAKIIKSDNATLIEGACIDIINSEKERANHAD